MSLDEDVGHEPEWRQLEMLRRFNELTRDGRAVATLRFESSCGSLAAGQCEPAQWSFKMSGFLSPEISVREAGAVIAA